MADQIRDHGFISYVRENKEQIDRLCNELIKNEVKVWLDRNDIKPGARWKDVIREAINEGSFFIACFSQEYLSKTETHMNEELTLAIERLRKFRSVREWFIPVLLSECDVPTRSISGGGTLRDIQWVPLYEDWKGGIQSIISLISKREMLGLRITEPKEIYHLQEYVKVSGKGAIPGNAIILITSLYGKYLEQQDGGVIADDNGEWQHPGCHFHNVDKKRFVYALSVKTKYEAEVRRLLKEKKGLKTENAMLKFSEYLDNKNISHQRSQAIMMIRQRS